MNKFFGDRVIDDQGSVKTIASAADARLYYVDLNTNRIPYLLSGDVESNEVIYETCEEITFAENTYFTCTNTLTSINLSLTPIKNTLCYFKTGDSITYTVTFGEDMVINKEIELEANSSYVIAIDNSIICWSKFIETE